MNRMPIFAVIAAVATLSVSLWNAVPAAAQTKPAAKPAVAAKKKAAPKKKTAIKSAKKSVSKHQSDIERREQALKRLKDYTYVKSMSPYAGSSTKW
jgi:hypothetical protein